MLVLARPVQAPPGRIVGPIAAIFGHILNFLFNLVYAITPNNSLGFAIILLTIIAMIIMLPLGVKSQRSMANMQKLNPEVEKIKAKYGGSKDPEIQKKIQQETQALYAKHKVNPLGGCLPMLIQMPLFFGLLFIMQNSFMYVDTLHNVYIELAGAIQAVPGYLDIVGPMHWQFVPERWWENNVLIQHYYSMGMTYEQAVAHVGGNHINLATPEHLARVLDRFQSEHWQALFAAIPDAYLPRIHELYEHRNVIVVFFGLPLLENSGLTWPGIIVPFMTVITTLGQSWIMQLVNKPKDDRAKTQQTMMMVVMPVFMGFITVTMPAGVGLYWIFSNLFRLIQQLVMNKQQGVKFRLPFIKPSELD